jgi:hypothetical protein
LLPTFTNAQTEERKGHIFYEVWVRNKAYTAQR